jgi:hypothetical protein
VCDQKLLDLRRSVDGGGGGGGGGGGDVGREELEEKLQMKEQIIAKVKNEAKKVLEAARKKSSDWEAKRQQLQVWKSTELN